MHKKNVIGFATDIGGRTSHTAIMAKSLEIPAVVGLEKITKIVQNSDSVIVDGNRGIIIVAPQKKTLERYLAERKKYEELEKELSTLKNLPSETLDGRKIELSANIEIPEEMEITVSPLVGYTNLVGSLSICGIPPLGGFWSKLIIILACVQAKQPLLALTAAMVSALTLAYYFRALGPAIFAPAVPGAEVVPSGRISAAPSPYLVK